jgi:hypothetical protein
VAMQGSAMARTARESQAKEHRYVRDDWEKQRFAAVGFYHQLPSRNRWVIDPDFGKHLEWLYRRRPEWLL